MAIVLACGRFMLLAALLAGAVVACASYTDDTQRMRHLFQEEQFSEALARLNESPIRDQHRNRLLYHLEKGMILDRMGKHKDARGLLMAADKIADELYTTSVTNTAMSFVVNDASTDYAGEDYEKVAIHTELSLSFLQDGDLANARVEAAKINNKLAEINQGYESNKDRYAEDAFARFLSAMIYEARGEYDDAIIDYANALKVYEGAYRDYFDTSAPVELVGPYHALLVKRGRTARATEIASKYPQLLKEAKSSLPQAGDGELVVIHEVGQIAFKVSESFVLPIGRQIVRFSFPVIRHGTGYRFGGCGVELWPNRQMVEGNIAQDMDTIAKASLEDRRGRMIIKEGARLLAKGQITEQAYKSFGPLGGIAANIYSVVTETADTRSWTTLPAVFYVTRVRLPAGKHQVAVRTNGRVGQVRNVQIDAGKIFFIRDFS